LAGSDNYRGLGKLGPQAAKGLGRQAGRPMGRWVEMKKERRKEKERKEKEMKEDKRKIYYLIHLHMQLA
jgi:5'-3' exonuclease